jgi:hypothetical protein
MTRYNQYAERIVPILLEHDLITEDERTIFEEYMRGTVYDEEM